MLDVAGSWVSVGTRSPLILLVRRGCRRCVRFVRSRFFSAWRWTLRLSLLGLMLLSGTALYWLWYDNIYGNDWTAIVGGAFLTVMAGTLGPWFFAAWIFDDIQ
jgi:hypothetical protein